MKNTTVYPQQDFAYAVLEIEYQQLTRPCDVTSSGDDRLLAVAWERIRISRQSTGGESVHPIDGEPSDHVRLIYGFSHAEPWGMWSEGGRSCLVLEVGPPGEDIVLGIQHHVLDADAQGVAAKVWVNGTALPDVTFRKGEVEIPVPAALVERLRAPAASLPAGPVPLSVIIVNFNRWDLTIACCAALRAAETPTPFEIIVVDNGSDHRSVWSSGVADLPIRLIRLEDRRSFGEATNVGVEAALGHDVLLLNNDAFVVGRCVESLQDALHADAATGATGPVFRYPDGRIQEVGGFVTTSGSPFRRSRLHARPTGMGVEASPVDYISAACLMMRRDTYLRVGGFDPVYEPAYYEDVDLCLRISARGLNVTLVPDAMCRHVEGATRSRLADDLTRESPERSGRVFSSRWQSWAWDRSKAELPEPPEFDFDRWQAGCAGMAEEGACAIVLAEPLEAATRTHSTLAAIAAASRAQPVVVTSSTPYSGLRLLQLAERFSLSLGPVATGAMDDIRLVGATTSVLVSERLPPCPGEMYGRRILYCPAPRNPVKVSAAEGREIVRSLLGLDCIVTDSFFARERIERSLRAIRAPFIRIEVAHPPVLAAPPSLPDQTGKRPIVLAIGRLTRGPAGGSHHAVLRAFRAFRAQASRSDWRLVAVGDLGFGDDLRHLTDLETAGADLGIDVVLNPSRRQRLDLLGAARVVVVAQGLGAPASDRSSCTMSGAEVATAVGLGCVPVVYEFGAAAEMCEDLGIGFRIGSASDIADALESAATLAEGPGVGPAHHRRLERVGSAAHEERWRQILAGDSPQVGVDPRNAGETRAREAARTLTRGRALVVLGMHRSGTSAMARALALSGANLPEDLMPPQTDNPTGFWEPSGITAFNDRMLGSLDLGWDDVFCFEPKDALADPYGEATAEARALLQGSFAGRSPIVLKDPRITLERVQRSPIR